LLDTNYADQISGDLLSSIQEWDKSGEEPSLTICFGGFVRLTKWPLSIANAVSGHPLNLADLMSEEQLRLMRALEPVAALRRELVRRGRLLPQASSSGSMTRSGSSWLGYRCASSS
jgi:hypothetical protein